MLQPFLCQKHKQYIKNVWLKLYEESAVLILNCSFNIFIQLTLNLPMVLEKSAGTKRLFISLIFARRKDMQPA